MSEVDQSLPQKASWQIGYRWIVLVVASMAQATASVVSQGSYVMVPFWREAFVLSEAQTGALLAAMNGGQILSMIPLGTAIDRYGERVVVGVTMLAMSAVSFAIGHFVDSYVGLLFGLVALGAFYASVQPGGTRAILKWFPPSERGFAMGIRQSGLPLGTAAAALLLPALAISAGWRNVTLVQAGIGMAGALLFLALHRDRDLPPQGGAKGRIPFFALLKIINETPGFKATLAAGAIMAGFQYTFSTFVVVYLASAVKAQLLTASSLFALTQIVGVVGRVSLVSISDRLWPGRRTRTLSWLMISCAGLTLSLLMLPAGASTGLLVPLLAAFGLAGIGWYPVWLLQVGENAPKEAVAATVSFAMTLNLVVISLSPPLFGLIADLGGYVAAWIAVAVGVTIGALALRERRVPVA